MIAALLRRCGRPAAWLLAALLLAPGIAAAQAVRDAAPLQFQDVAEERRFNALVSELRCVMCQNQSLADSNAQIAHDLRREVLALMRAGNDDEALRAAAAAAPEPKTRSHPPAPANPPAAPELGRDNR